MKFIIEQLFLNDESGKPLPKTGEPAYFRSDAETPHQALSAWLDAHGATLLGDVSDFYGYQSVATARIGLRLFSLHVYPGSDTFLKAKMAAVERARHPPGAAEPPPAKRETDRR